MTWIYVWTSEIKNVYVWTTPVKEVYLWDTKIRPKPMPAWIYHNSTLWLISLSSDWQTWITIADKNLGATAVWNSWDALSQANCGKYYQRWNNYGFPFTWSVTTSSSKVNAQNYWPWNYYSSSTFITASTGGWDSSKNRNLWGETTNTLAARQWPCASWYHVPTQLELTSLTTIWVALWWWANDWTNFGATLRMPFAWYRYPSPWGQGNYGFYWSSYINGNWWATNLSLWSSTIAPYNYNFSDSGYSIRPFKNDAVQPDDSRTKLY